MHILLADDQPKVRSALQMLLEQQPWATAIFETDDAGADAFASKGDLPRTLLATLASLILDTQPR